MLVHVNINGIDYVEDSSSTILETAADHGIKIPTLCFLKREDCMLEYKPASCRVCIVEVEGRRNLVPACATKIEDGMVIRTNSLRVRAERKAIVELLLSNHPNDCLKCEKNRKCSLQDLAEELGIQRINFEGPLSQENVEIEKYGEPVVPEYEVPYHTDILENLGGLDIDSAGRTSGNGFYYLRGNIARLQSAILSYARDFMIDRGFEYFIPPFMIHSDVVTGVMSFAEMQNMMYKIEGEDLYLIGTSEHSMVGRFINQILRKEDLPYTLTSYSPCFRKEVGAHGIEERGLYRVHQFEKQEMVVVCEPEDSPYWYEQLWKNSVDFFRSLDIPVRTLECCSGDLADLKVKSCDVEAWSPRQKKYFEVGSCSNLGDAQARRLGIRVKGEKGNYFAHTLNNTVVAPPRMLIAFIENNLNADGSINIPKPLQPYMGGQTVITKPEKTKKF